MSLKKETKNSDPQTLNLKQQRHFLIFQFTVFIIIYRFRLLYANKIRLKSSMCYCLSQTTRSFLVLSGTNEINTSRPVTFISLDSSSLSNCVLQPGMLLINCSGLNSGLLNTAIFFKKKSYIRIHLLMTHTMLVQRIMDLTQITEKQKQICYFHVITILTHFCSALFQTYQK